MGATGLMMGLNFLGAGVQASAQQAQGEYAEKMSRINARRLEMQEEEALQRGETAAVRQGEKVKQIVGSQRAALAAQGIVVGSGDAAALQRETELAGARDINTIRNNAFRESLGFRMSSEDAIRRGQIAKMAGEQSAQSTLLTGGLKSLSYGIENKFFDKMKDWKIDFGSKKEEESTAAYNKLFQSPMA